MGIMPRVGNWYRTSGGWYAYCDWDGKATTSRSVYRVTHNIPEILQVPEIRQSARPATRYRCWHDREGRPCGAELNPPVPTTSLELMENLGIRWVRRLRRGDEVWLPNHRPWKGVVEAEYASDAFTSEGMGRILVQREGGDACSLLVSEGGMDPDGSVVLEPMSYCRTDDERTATEEDALIKDVWGMI